MPQNLVFCRECFAIRAWKRTFATKESPATAEMSCGHTMAVSDALDGMLPTRRYRPREEYR